MTYDFDRIVDRRSTNDLKYRVAGLKAFFDMDVSDAFIPMWIADTDFACAPCIVDAMKARADKEIYGYCGRQGNYFEALRWWYQTRSGLELKPEWLTTLPSIVAAINMGIRTFSEPGDKVIIQQPVYDPFEATIQKTGRVLANNPLIFRDGDYCMNFEELEQLASDPKAKVMVLCSPHNPIGRVWTREELEKVADICARNNVFVIVDEIHSDIIYPGVKHTPFPLVAKGPHMFCTAPSKTFNVAGLKCSNIFIPDAACKAKLDKNIVDHALNINSTFAIEVVPAAYTPEGAEWLDQLMVYLEGNANIVDAWCKEHGVAFKKPDGGFVCWLDLGSVGMDDAAIRQKICLEQEVVCVPGTWFGVGGENHLRLNIGCPRSILTDALDRIAKTF